MAVGAIFSIISTGLNMIDKHINDPKRRLEARQEFIDECKKKIGVILNVQEIEELDRLLLDFVSTIHNL